MRPVAALALAVALLLAALPARAAPPELVVLAAVSLTESLSQVAAAWTRAGHPVVRFSFDASSRLARQVEAGAPADVFVSADAEWMDHLQKAGLVDAATRADLVGNRLVVVAPAASPWTVSAPGDLAAPSVRRVGLAGEAVPAGRYARAALERLGLWAALAPRVVNGDNVRSVLAWAAAGEVDAGVVYASDARVEPRVRVVWTFAADTHPPIVYPGAVVKGSRSAAEAAAFLRYCRGPEAASVFRAAGFEPPSP